MGTISGRYVRTFAEADTGMLEGVSLNAPYPFFWLELKLIEGSQLVCVGAGEEMRLPFRHTRRGDRALVTIQDPIFGPLEIEVLPFLQGAPKQGTMFA